MERRWRIRGPVAPGEFMKRKDWAEVSCCVGGLVVLRTGVPSTLARGFWTRATWNQSTRGAQEANILSCTSNGYKRSQAARRGMPAPSMKSGRYRAGRAMMR
jgi:hypothetical protein